MKPNNRNYCWFLHSPLKYGGFLRRDTPMVDARLQLAVG